MSSLAPKAPFPVLGHVGVAVGKLMLIWGGYTMSNDYDMFPTEPYVDPKLVWVYDAEYNEWHVVTTQGDIPQGTSGAGGVIIDNHLYVFGGYTNRGNTNDLYKLNLESMTWTLLDCEMSDQPAPRDKFMYWADDQKFYVFGGFGTPTRGFSNENGTFLSDESFQTNRGWNNQLFVFDTISNQWSNPKCLGSLPSPRAAGATAKIGHHVYLFGGRHGPYRLNDFFVCNLHTLEWTRLHPHGVCPSGRSWHTCTAISDRHIVLYGGYTQDQTTLGELWFYDIHQMEWQLITRDKRPEPRLWHTSCYTSANDLLVFGGCSNDILSTQELAKSHNDVLVFRFSPHSLLRLCLDASHKHRLALQVEPESLPRVLLDQLKKRLKSVQEDGEEETGQTKTCSIS